MGWRSQRMQSRYSASAADEREANGTDPDPDLVSHVRVTSQTYHALNLSLYQVNSFTRRA